MRTLIKMKICSLALLATSSLCAQSLPVLSIEGSRAVAEESTRDPVRLTVVSDRPAPEPGLPVRLGFAGGSARPGIDFLLPEDMPMIAAGSSSITVELTIIDNDEVDGDRTLAIEIRPSQRYQVGEPSRFMLLIRDDDDSEASLRQRLRQLVDRTPDPLVASQIETLGRLCASERPPADSELARRCGILRLALRDPDAAVRLVTTLRSLIAEDLSSQRRGFRSLAQSQFAPLSQRMSNLRRSEAGGLDFSGLTVQRDGLLLPLSWLHSSAASDTLAGRGYGVFLSGNLGHGRRRSGELESGYDSDSDSLMIGVDYRINPNWVLGGFLSRARFRAEMNDGLGNLRLRQHSAGLYLGSSLADGRGFVDAALGWGRGDLRQQRAVRFEADTDEGSFLLDDLLLGRPDAQLRHASLAAGYDFTRRAWNLGPRVALEYAQLRIDEFEERAVEGSDAFAVALDTQRLPSLIGRLGLSATGVTSTRFGVLRAQFDGAWVRQFRNETDPVVGRFINDPQGLPFELPTAPIDSNYGEVGLALSAQFAHGRSAYVGYRRLFGIDDTRLAFWSLGLRFEF